MYTAGYLSCPRSPRHDCSVRAHVKFAVKKQTLYRSMKLVFLKMTCVDLSNIDYYLSQSCCKHLISLFQRKTCILLPYCWFDCFYCYPHL